MKTNLLPAVLLLLTGSAFAADLPSIPEKPIAAKKELLFSDDFEGTTRPEVWHRVVPTFAFEQGTLKGTQTRDKTIPAADGKREITAHAAVHGLEIPTTNSIVETRIRFDGATMIDVEFDDRKYTGAHYGHICRAQVRLDSVLLIDERDGGMRNDIYEWKKDPAKKAEVTKLLVGRSAKYPAKLEPGRWYTLVVETAGDEMRVTIDGQPAGYLKSSGIAHATKSKIELGVAGKDGYFDDIKVWNAEPTKQASMTADVSRLADAAAPTKVRYLVVALCTAMSVLLYLDRFAISPATDSVLRELNLDKEQFGRTSFAFFFAYALMQVPAGWLSDRFGARGTLALYVVGWSLATLSLGLVNGLAAIVIVRLVLGVTQAGAYPAAASLLKRWIPASARGRANTIVAMGSRAGSLISFSLTPTLMLLIGQGLSWEKGRWRIVFMLYGVLGFFWAAPFWWLYRDRPRLHPWCNEAEAELIGESTVQARRADDRSLPIEALFRSPEVWLICGCNCAVNLGWIFLATWLPQYLVEKHGDYLTATVGDKLVVAGVMTALTGLTGICGGLIGGATTDRLVRAYGLAWGRRLPGMCAGVIVCGLYLVASQLHDVWFFVGFMLVIGFTIEFGLGASWAVYQDIAGQNVASVLGIGNMCGKLAAGVFAWLIGLLAKDGNWQTVFYISAGAMVMNSVCWFFFDSSRPIWKEQN